MDFDAFKKNMEELGIIGKSENGGINRIFGSNEILIAQQYIFQYMKNSGMECWIDPVGNVHGIYKCNNKSAHSILIGSHFDTVKEGGCFDGVLGVVGAIECVKELNKMNITLKHDIHVIATNGEEGNDLGGTVGSRAMMGLIDYNKSAFLSKAKEFNLTKEDFKNTQIDTQKIDCYLELHIEQGKTLEIKNKEIGIVTGIVGLERYLITVSGTSNHAGTTMMEYRDDALVKSSRIILYVNELAKAFQHNFVATIGKLENFPNAVAVIPSQVKMVLEIRNQDASLMSEYMSKIKEKINHEKKIIIEPLIKKRPVQCSASIIQTIQEVCTQQSFSYQKMPSGATHDGNAMALKMPIGMIFVPSKGGVSHSKYEWTEYEQAFKGVKVLYETIKKVDEKIEDTHNKS